MQVKWTKVYTQRLHVSFCAVVDYWIVIYKNLTCFYKAISRSRWGSTTGVTEAVVCVILFVE